MGSHIPTCPSLHSHETTATQQHNSEDTAVIALDMHLTAPTVHPSRRSRRSVRLRRRPSRMPRPSSTRSTARHKRRQLTMPSRRRRSSTKRNGNCSNHLPTQACTAAHTLMAHTATVQEVSQAHTDTEHHTELDTEHHTELDTELEHEDTDMDTEQEPLVAITKCDE